MGDRPLDRGSGSVPDLRRIFPYVDDQRQGPPFADPEFREKFLEANQMEPIVGSPEQLADLIRVEALHWSKVIKDNNLKLE